MAAMVFIIKYLSSPFLYAREIHLKLFRRTLDSIIKLTITDNADMILDET